MNRNMLLIRVLKEADRNQFGRCGLNNQQSDSAFFFQLVNCVFRFHVISTQLLC